MWRAMSMGVVTLLALAPWCVAQENDSNEVQPPVEIVVPAEPGEVIPTPEGDPPPEIVVPDDGSSRGEGGAKLRIGQFVGGDVELFPHVVYRHKHEIHPQAVPMIVAVMHPNEGPWHPHYRRHRWRHGRRAWRKHETGVVETPLVFVKVMVPPYPPHRVRVKHEEVDLYYGHHRVNVDPEDGVVKVKYDD